jgi:exosortase
LGWLNLALVAVLVTGVTLYLWPQWRHNPDLQHGWFTPLIFVLLIHEARTRGTQRFLQPCPRALGAIVTLLVTGLILLVAGGLYMAALEWTHALVAAMLTGALCALLGATWIDYSFKSVRLVPFNWPAGVAILLWLLSSPLPPGTYGTLTHGLQAGVTSSVLGVLHFLGIAAVRHGNIIQLTNAAVGIEEACSGVRSLISSIYAGFFFSATLVRGRGARALIVVLAAPLAIAMNLLRSLTLTLLAHHGVEIGGVWHDATGFAILGLTSALLAGLAIRLNRRTASVSEIPRRHETASMSTAPVVSSSRRSQLLVASGLALAVCVAALLILNTRPADNPGRPAPDLAAVLPTHYDGWTVTASDELFQFAAQLQTDRLAQTTYNRPTPQGQLEITVYVAYWPEGKTPVSFVAAHTPDACWPGSGWVANPVPNPRLPLAIGDRNLDDAEYRLFTQGVFSQHVWFWHLYNGRVIYPEGARSPRQLLLLAFKYGFHREGEQLFVRVSSNQPWNVIATEPLLQEIFARLAPLGL